MTQHTSLIGTPEPKTPVGQLDLKSLQFEYIFVQFAYLYSLNIEN